jgi:hypothetical protein
MLHGMVEFLYLVGFAHSIYTICMPLTSFSPMETILTSILQIVDHHTSTSILPDSIFAHNEANNEKTRSLP